MDFYVKKTSEMADQELHQLLNLFNKVFEKDRPMEVLLNQYTQNPFGYSYHSYFVDEGKIQGAITCIPSYYVYKGERMIFATIVDAMVAEEHRDLFGILRLLNNAYKELKNEGAALTFCYPNDDAYTVYTKAKTMLSIGKMRTYCLPYRIGGIKKGLKPLNVISEGFAWCWVWALGLLSSGKTASFPIHKEDETYNATRYHRSDGKYNIVEINDFVLYYKIREQEGVRTAFIIDINKKSSRNFNKAMKYLLRKERHNFDLLLYSGILPFNNSGLVCIPEKLEPKNFYMVGKILDNRLKKEDVFSVNNWDSNLSNYDLI